MSFKAFIEGSVDAIVNQVILPLLLAAAFISFVWGILQYFFLHADSEESRRQGRQLILWGILGFTIIFSVWGIVYILLDILGIAPA